jgi:cysteine synthase B
LPQSKEFLDFVAKYPPLLTIGNTPAARISLPQDLGDAEIYAKFEHLNPGGSLKDRPVLRMVVEAILSGELTKDKIILDATSGNAGISYAMIGAMLGYKVELVMPENASEERKKRIRAHHASIVYTDAILGYDESLHEVKRRHATDPDLYFHCDQYSNPNNPMAHYDTTAVEILRQVPDVTHFVAGVGTGGTITGVGRRLKEHNPAIQVIGINPPEWPGIEGLKPLGEDHIKPDTFDETVVDEMLPIDVDDAYRMSGLLASIGLFAGQSTGGYMQGAYEVAKKHRKGKIVTIFNDIGERYFSTGMWDSA